MTQHIIYHTNCVDGIAAAYIAWTRLNPNAVLTPWQYNQPFPLSGLSKEDEIYIVDFSFPRQTLLDVHSQVDKLLVIDHHSNMEADIADLPFVIFDTKESGASLAWKHFYPCMDTPYAIQLVKDYDLWNHSLAHTNVFNKIVKSRLTWQDMDYWDRIVNDCKFLNNELSQGSVLVEQEESYIAKMSSPASPRYRLTTFKGYRVATFNTTFAINEVSAHLLVTEKIDFTVNYEVVSGDGRVVFNLRSLKGSQMNVGAFAKQYYGGGGHQSSGGFITDMDIGLKIIQQLYTDQGAL